MKNNSPKLTPAMLTFMRDHLRDVGAAQAGLNHFINYCRAELRLDDSYLFDVQKMEFVKKPTQEKVNRNA